MKRNGKGTSAGAGCRSALIRAVAACIVLWGVPPAQAQAVIEGTVEWARRASLGVPVTGIVARADAAPGDRVESGEVLVALDRGRLDAAVAAARARVARLAPDVAEARREFERAGDMYERTLISEHDLELARIALARIEADEAQAQAMLRIAEIDRARSVVRAPFAGVVIERRVEVGEVVNARASSAPLIVLGDVSRLVARARLAPDALAGWSAGLDAAVLIAGRRIEGQGPPRLAGAGTAGAGGGGRGRLCGGRRVRTPGGHRRAHRAAREDRAPLMPAGVDFHARSRMKRTLPPRRQDLRVAPATGGAGSHADGIFRPAAGSNPVILLAGHIGPDPG